MTTELWGHFLCCEVRRGRGGGGGTLTLTQCAQSSCEPAGKLVRGAVRAAYLFLGKRYLRNKTKQKKTGNCDTVVSTDKYSALIWLSNTHYLTHSLTHRKKKSLQYDAKPWNEATKSFLWNQIDVFLQRFLIFWGGGAERLLWHGLFFSLHHCATNMSASVKEGQRTNLAHDVKQSFKTKFIFYCSMFSFFFFLTKHTGLRLL